jgi:hypothetical protein
MHYVYASGSRCGTTVVAMSFDVFLQAFRDGGTGAADPAVIEEELAAYIAVRDGDFARLVTRDGDAECYGLGLGSLMVTHAGGEAIWDLVVEVARAAGLVILPVGCPACVIDPRDRRHLPLELQGKVVTVQSGADLLAVIRTT